MTAAFSRRWRRLGQALGIAGLLAIMASLFGTEAVPGDHRQPRCEARKTSEPATKSRGITRLTGHNERSMYASARLPLVNIPAASIEAVEVSQVVQRHAAVVGKVDRQTPILNSKVHQIKFNPYWTVPKSIIRKDLIKYMNEDPEYLTKFRIKIFDGKGNEIQPYQIDWSTEDAVSYTFRQDPGAENSLGRCKIDFYNKHAVYLHDTSAPELFAQARRTLSSGCVRVEKPRDLATWLTGTDAAWPDSALQPVDKVVPLAKPVPVHLQYWTAWVDEGGRLHQRADVYERDARVLRALREPAPN